jgi:adenine/guanine phosphoribosyltransferase-like PRPP-binding protein
MADLHHPIGLSLKENLPTIKQMGNILVRMRLPKLGLVCTGSSGAIIAGIIGSMFKITPAIIYIRKQGETGHYHGNQHEVKRLKNLVFVDDFVSSGDTADYVVNQLREMGVKKIRGICLCNDHCMNSIDDQEFFQERFIPKE